MRGAVISIRHSILLFSWILLYPVYSVYAAPEVAGDRFSTGVSAGASSGSSVGVFAGEWFFIWGYNRDYYLPTDIHVSQPSLGNDFTVHSVHGNDYPQWNEGAGIFDKDITVPQFNFRVGHYINQEQDLALEFSIDHTKFSSQVDQIAHVTGTVGGAPIDSQMQLSSNYFTYNLHNGINHIMLSLMKRSNIFGELNRSLSMSLLFKGGLGIVLPHAENTIMGNNSNVGPKTLSNAIGLTNGWWQLNGWTAGVEVGLRFVLLRPLFFDISDKIAYASLANVPVYMGRADQNLWMNEWMFDLGITINPKFMNK